MAADIPVSLDNNKMSQLRSAFQLFDYDKDGKIFSQDIGALLRAIDLKPSEAEIKRIKQTVDTQLNREIDLQTLVKFINDGAITNPAPERPDDLRDMFRMYDPNGSGKISVSEMRHVLTSVGEKLTDEEVESILKMSGCVQGGYVDIDKFVRTVMS